jgi:hypothetical protein
MAVKLAVSADSGPSVLLFTKESGNLRAMKIIVLSQKKHHVSLLPTSRPRLFRLAMWYALSAPAEARLLCLVS